MNTETKYLEYWKIYEEKKKALKKRLLADNQSKELLQEMEKAISGYIRSLCKTIL